MLSEGVLITKCLKNDLKAQEELYKRYASIMYGICIRFVKNEMDAKDIDSAEDWIIPQMKYQFIN